MNTAKDSNVKSIAVISLVSVMLFGIFYYLITDATSNPSSQLKAESDRITLQATEQKTVAQKSVNDAVVADSKAVTKPQETIGDISNPDVTKQEVKGDATETSVFKALSTQKTDVQAKMVLGGADTQTPESTVPDTGSETLFGAFVLSSLIMFTGIYLMLTQPKNVALAKFEKRIIRELD